MTKEKRLLNLSLILAICGVVLIAFSGSIGKSFSNFWLQRQPGGMIDTDVFLFMMNSYQISALVIGGILFAVCLPTALYAWYQTLKNVE